MNYDPRLPILSPGAALDVACHYSLTDRPTARRYATAALHAALITGPAGAAIATAAAALIGALNI